MNKPQTGDKFVCKECGMEIQVTKDCNCGDHGPQFECCGKPLETVA
jgi:hypothetical protein